MAACQFFANKFHYSLRGFFFGKDENKRKELELSNKISKTKSLIKLVHLLTLQKYNLKKWKVNYDHASMSILQ